MKHVERFPELTAAFAHARKLGQYNFTMLCSFNVQPYYVSDIVEVNEARKQLRRIQHSYAIISNVKRLSMVKSEAPFLKTFHQEFIIRRREY